ncbi:MAG TPA: hypothetical protein VK866_07150 [Acidimicrobiales bacterium]|nr:hypothetical protein [Acidimicrobiales bacterium]
MTRIVALVTAALVLAVVVDLATGAKQPGLVPAFSLVGTVALVLGAKALGRHLVSRPAGSRPGESLTSAPPPEPRADGAGGARRG